MIIVDSRRPDNLIAPSRRQSADCEAYASDDSSLEHLHVVVSEKVYNTAQSRVCEVQKEAGVKWRIIRLDGAFTQALRKEERQRSTTASEQKTKVELDAHHIMRCKPIKNQLLSPT